MCCFKVTLTRLYNHYQIPQFQSRTSVRLYARLGVSVTRCLKKILSSSVPQILKSLNPLFIPIRKLHIEIAEYRKQSAV